MADHRRPPQIPDYSLIDVCEPSIVGNEATTPAFKNKINERIASANHCNTIAAVPSIKSDLFKAANFPAQYIKIGSWQRNSRHDADIVVKCYFKKAKFAWEILEDKIKFKMEFKWSEIQAIRAQPTTLDIMLKNPPLFYKEKDPQPRKHTNWEVSTDFTGQQASTVRRHTIKYAPNAFYKHLSKAVAIDSNLRRLQEQPFPDDGNIYFSPAPHPSSSTLSFDCRNACVEESGPSTKPGPSWSQIRQGRTTNSFNEAHSYDALRSPYQGAGEFPSDLCGALNSSSNTGLAISSPGNNRHAPMTNSSYTSNHMGLATSYPSNNCSAMANSYSGNCTAMMTSYPSNNCHAPMTNSSYTNDHMAVATSYTSNNCAAMANSYSGNRTAVMTSYPSNSCHAAMAESSYFGNHMVVATSSPSNDTAVSTSYNSNDHHELSNSFNSGYDYHAVESNMMAAAFLGPDINACTNLPPTSSGFTQGLPPLPPPQFFQNEQQLISTAHDSQMIGCNGDTDLILHENLNDHASCNSLQEFTVASSTLDHTNTVPVCQSENDPHAPMTNSSYTNDHMAVATSYTSNNCAAMANSYSGNRTAVMTSYPSNSCHAAMAESSYFGNHMVVATSSPSNDTAVSTSYNSNDHHELSNSFNSGYDYHAVESNMMAAAFLGPDINACTNLPPTSSGFTQGLPPLPPPQFFQNEQQLISTAHDSQMIGCNGDTDLILHENLNDHASCNSLQEFTVASSTLDHTNTVPVCQSENDPRWMIHHNNHLDHAVQDVGSDCGVIVGTGMELGDAILTSGMLPVENRMDTLFLNYGESVNSTSPPGVCDGDLITDADASKWWWWWARGLLADESV